METRIELEAEYEHAKKQARAYGRHAMMLERETLALAKAGYYFDVGPREDAEGRRIYASVEKEMAAMPPITDAEVDAYLAEAN